jgi:hypothetical protein
MDQTAPWRDVADATENALVQNSSKNGVGIKPKAPRRP